MAPTKLSELKIGMQFHWANCPTDVLQITKIRPDDFIEFEYTHKKGMTQALKSEWFLNKNVLEYISEYKREYLCPIIAKQCKHINIREDRYFSAMVYRTCKDCGHTFN